MESLMREYCPPLDEALFFALASDYDIHEETQVAQLRAALDGLRDSAVEEQELEMLPIPNVDTSHHTDPVTDEVYKVSAKRAESSRPTESDVRSTTDDDVTSATTGISRIGFSEGGSENHDSILSRYGETGDTMKDLSEGKKCEWLMKMFPNVDEQDVRKVLSQCNGKFDQSTDELLNLSFLRDDGHSDQTPSVPVVKGVEGFALSDNESQVRRKIRGKRRRKGNRTDDDDDASLSESAQMSGTTTPDTNVWKSAPKDIEYIASRTRLSHKMIASVYHANRARLAPTVRTLINKEAEIYSSSPGEVESLVHWQVEELKLDLAHIPAAQIYGALMLADKMPGAAIELLQAMTASNEEPVMLGKVTGLASYAPLDLSDGEGVRKKLPATWNAVVPSEALGYTLTHMGNLHGVAASQAFQQAQNAHRKGKSDRLMGGAAAYYAQVGHDHVRAAKALQAHEADALVAGQSTSTTLDLHGVNVQQAVRIARDGTERWWEGLGDRKYVPVGGTGQGFQIITGVGMHSADGIGRIGPAVSKMLVREGWKIEIGRGDITVRGRTGRK